MTLSASSFATANSTRIKEKNGQATIVMEDYHNLKYGFSVPVITGMRAYRSTAPNPDHGLFYRLGKHRRISVWVDYDVLFLGGLRTQKDNFISTWRVKTSQAKEIKLAGEAALLLSGRESDSYVYAVLQYRKEGIGILYYLVLQTDKQHKDIDRAMLLRIAGKFRWESLQDSESR